MLNNSKKYKIINNNKNNKKQYGGFLYITYSRLEISKLPVALSNGLIYDAIKLNRYYHKYYDLEYKLQEEGVHSALGPPDFVIQKNDYRNYDIDMYETILIYDTIVKLNDLLSKYNIQTIQSGIAYYEDDITFSKPYLQLPFIEFVADKDCINIMKEIVNHPSVKDYYVFSYTCMDGRIKSSITRPYLDDNNNCVTEFDDSVFWDTIVRVATDVSNKNMEKENLTINDPELDIEKDWYILEKQEDFTIHFVKIENKCLLNPLVDGVVLSTLDVRYEPKFNLFKRTFNYYDI